MRSAKNNIRTTTSSFVTRIQCIENLNRVIHNKQGDVSYLFYNFAKNFFFTEVGVKAKVSWPLPLLTTSSSNKTEPEGAPRSNIFLSVSYVS